MYMINDIFEALWCKLFILWPFSVPWFFCCILLFSVFLFLRKLLSVCLYCTSSALNKSILLSLFLPCQFCSHNACTQLRRLSDTTGLDDSTAGSSRLHLSLLRRLTAEGMGWHGAATEHGNAASMVRTETTVQRRQLLLSIADRGLAPMPLDISTLIRPGWLNNYSD